MEEIKNKYVNGKIYTIRSYQTDKIYIGSTCCALPKRFYEHKYSGNQCSSKEMLEYNDCYIELLESYPCNSKEELTKREGELIRENKDNCVNIKIPNNDPKIRLKKYKQSPKGKAKIKEFNQTDKGKVIKKRSDQKYRESEKGKEAIKIRAQKRYDNRQYVNCECGSKYYDVNKRKHINTLKHLNFINKDNNNINPDNVD